MTADLALVKTCSIDCGARCCRTPSMRIRVRTQEMRALKTAGTVIGVDPKFHHLGQDYRGSLWQLQLEAGQCVFLDDDTNLCRAYDARPEACRSFPHRAFKGCLLSPGGDDDPEVGSPDRTAPALPSPGDPRAAAAPTP